MRELDFSNCATSCLPERSAVTTRLCGDYAVEIFHQAEAIAAEWRTLEAYSNDPYSSRAWVGSWYKACEQIPDYTPTIILGRNQTQSPEFILPLVKRKLGPFNLLVRPGHKHSTYYRGLFSPGFEKFISGSDSAEFWSSVFSTVPKADVVVLDGIFEGDEGDDNPLSQMPGIKSSNSAFRMELIGDWENQYKDLTNSKDRSNDTRCKR